MLYRLRQFVVASAHLLLAYLLYRLVRGNLDWGTAWGCIILSAFWLGITGFSARRLFACYFDYPSRMRARASIALGIVLSSVAIWLAGVGPSLTIINEPWHKELTLHLIELKPDLDPIMFGAGLAALTGWTILLVLYRFNSGNFVMTRWGFVHRDWWLNPPLEAIPDLAAAVTSGTIGPRGKNPAGHLEIPFTEKLVRYFFSSWMDRGTTIFEAQGLIDRKLAKDEHIIIAVPLDEPTAKQLADAPAVARKLKTDNEQWKKEATERRAALIARLPLPRKMKGWLTTKFEPTGYYWFGLLNGQTKDERGTCAGMGTTLWDLLGIKHEPRGKGLLSLGTGLGTPINPAKILVDRNFRVLTNSVDKARWEAGKQAASVQAPMA